MTHNINRGGGTEVAVQNIRQNYDVKSLGIGGMAGYFFSFFLALRIIFSDYDIIHAHDPPSIYGYTFVPKRFRKKILYSCHGLWETYFASSKKNTAPRFLISTQRRVIMRSDIVVATSRFRVREIKRLYGVEAEYVHNGVDTKKFRPAKSRKDFDFLWVGTNPNKGLRFALDTAKKRRGKLLVVGLQGESNEGVTYAGFVPHSKMPWIYARSKTLINYSTISRYDFVVLEAMACGMSVIINKESAEELIPGGNFGEIVTITGKSGRKIAERLSWEASIKKYNEIYRRLAK